MKPSRLCAFASLGVFTMTDLRSRMAWSTSPVLYSAYAFSKVAGAAGGVGAVTGVGSTAGSGAGATAGGGGESATGAAGGWVGVVGVGSDQAGEANAVAAASSGNKRWVGRFKRNSP